MRQYQWPSLHRTAFDIAFAGPALSLSRTEKTQFRGNVLVKVDSPVGKLAKCSSLLELGGLLGVLQHHHQRPLFESDCARAVAAVAGIESIEGTRTYSSAMMVVL